MTGALALAAVSCGITSCVPATHERADAPVADTNPIRIGPPVIITAGDSKRDYAEMVSASDPSNPSYLAACAMSFSGRGQGAPDARIFTSRDSGKTWTLGAIDSLGDIATDPSCAYGLDGEVLFSASSTEFIRGRFQHEFGDFFRSRDAGRTWRLFLHEPASPSNSVFIDRPYMNVDQTQSPYRGSEYYYGWGYFNSGRKVYSGASVFLSRITRTGLDGPTLFANTAQYADIAPMAGQGVITRKGALLIPMIIFPNGSHKAGATFIAATVSSDGGRTLRQPTLITETKWCTPGQVSPVAAVDNSNGPFAGRMYIAFTAPDDGATSTHPAHCHAGVTYSSDNGRTWSAPTVVSEDLRPLNQRGTQAAAAVAVNSRGVVALTWLDTRENPSAAVMRPRVAISYDGGASLTTSQPISENGEDYRLGQASGVWANISGAGFPQDEDYQGARGPLQAAFYPFVHFNGTPGDTRLMVADVNGHFHDFWFANTATPEHNTNLLTSTIQVKGHAYRNGDPTLDALHDSTKAVSVSIESTRYDGNGRFTVRMSLVNNSSHTIRGPLFARIIRVSSVYGAPSIETQTVNNLSTNGAVVDFSSCLINKVLAPGATSKPFKLQFDIKIPQSMPITDSLVDFSTKFFAS